MIPEEIVERVQASADIVGVIGEYVKLKRVGSRFRGPCPFHQGTHDNFSVTPNGGYRCFVCGEKGSVFTFLQKRLGVDFVEAVKLVAAKSGIEIPEADGKREGPDPREPYWEVNAAAAEYFTRFLWEEPAAQPARDYLASRRVSRETADRFGMGFAPREIGLMRLHLNTLGFDDARLLDAGLLVQREEQVEPRPRFRNRLLFPIYDPSGRTAGFGGRLIGPGEPKYLNSAESRVFSKGKLLYGLNWARNAIRRVDRALLVEGYFDALRLATAGLEEVVAPLGTALTADQAALLARYTKNVFLLYDSDDAGQKATFRSGLELLRLGVAVRVVSLPEGEDPDTFVDKYGRAKLEAQLDDAMDVFDRQVQILERKGWFAELHRRRRAIDKLLPTIRATVDPLTRDIYVARLSEVAGVAKELLLREAAALPDERPGAARNSAAAGGPPGRSTRSRTAGVEHHDDGPPPGFDEGPPPEMPPYDGGDFGGSGQGFKRRGGPGERRRGFKGRREADGWASNQARPRPSSRMPVGPERELTRAMLRDRAQVEVVAERYGPGSFRDATYRAIFAALLEQGADATLAQVAEELDEQTGAAMQQLMDEGAALGDPARSVQGCFAQLRVRELAERNEAIDGELATASEAEKDALTLEKQRNMKEIRELGGVGYKKFGKSRS
ncbi:MAG TPA: DNA primase [Gemmatimonadaceae bacterium]|nr:DNA primase [Gemmatimonadaceae bacterium]